MIQHGYNNQQTFIIINTQHLKQQSSLSYFGHFMHSSMGVVKYGESFEPVVPSAVAYVEAEVRH